MIKVNLGEISFEGSLPDIATEICVVNKQFKELCIKKMGEKDGTTFFEEIFELTNMNEEELKNKVRTAQLNVLRKLLGLGD